MSEEQREWMIPVPYPECDAAFYAYMPQLKRGNVGFQRSFRVATAGSSVYTFTIGIGNDAPLGAIRLRQVGDQTYVLITPSTKYTNSSLILILNAILRAFWQWHQDEIKRSKDIPLITSGAPGEVTTALQSAPEAMTDPKPGDSMDAWLDWRDREQQRTNHRISLTYIAKEGNFKIDTLKKKSAARRREQTEEVEDDE